MTDRVAYWCHDCEIVVWGDQCPKCGNSDFGLWRYHDPDQEMPPAHWPQEAPAEGTVLPLYPVGPSFPADSEV